MRLVAAVMLAIMVLSFVPTASAATSKTKTKAGTCDAGFSHIRATKATKKFDLNHNGWICTQAMRSKGKTTHEHRDDKVM